MNPWRSTALALPIALAIALTIFVSERNRTFQLSASEQSLGLAKSIAEGGDLPASAIAGGAVSPPQRSASHPFLSKRTLAGRRLGGNQPEPYDKLIYDAATRADRDGAFSEFTKTGEIVSAYPKPDRTGVLVWVPDIAPRPLPWFEFAVGIALALLLTAASNLFSGWTRFSAASTALVPMAIISASFGGWLAPTLLLATSIAAAALERAGSIKRTVGALSQGRAAYAFLLPTFVSMMVLVAVPFVVGISLGFFNHHNGEWTFVAFDNFIEILSGDGRALNDPLNFWFTLSVTILWTLLNVMLHASIGVALALLLSRSWLRGKGLFRVLLILPWAIPNYITALIWRGMFQSEYGAFNRVLTSLGLDAVSWFSQWSTAFAANLATNTWLGFPFMMVVAIGAIESIPKDMYEAAEIDGANAWQRFWNITLPNLLPALGPAIALGAIWTFNMFNVIFLVSEGRPGGGTEILVTEAYRWAFERGERYGLAAAYATVIFIILAAWTLAATRLSRRRADRKKNQ